MVATPQVTEDEESKFVLATNLLVACEESMSRSVVGSLTCVVIARAIAICDVFFQDSDVLREVLESGEVGQLPSRVRAVPNVTEVPRSHVEEIGSNCMGTKARCFVNFHFRSRSVKTTTANQGQGILKLRTRACSICRSGSVCTGARNLAIQSNPCQEHIRKDLDWPNCVSFTLTHRDR